MRKLPPRTALDQLTRAQAGACPPEPILLADRLIRRKQASLNPMETVIAEAARNAGHLIERRAEHGI
jgi:hypothetical protein